MDEERKGVLSYCFVNYEQGAIPLLKYLEIKGWKQENCGLTNIPHMKDMFGLYYSLEVKLNGIIRQMDSNEVCLSSIPKGLQQQAMVYFNRDGYSTYCKDYREYWDWVEKRNENRFENTKNHGKNYDAKNMMHVFRLLLVAKEIAVEGRINVWRKDREFLLNVKMGKYEYDDLVNKAESLRAELNELYQQSSLVDEPDLLEVNKLLVEMRKAFDDFGLSPTR